MSGYRNIVVAVDGSAASARGLQEALRLAKSDRAALAIVHVVNQPVPHAPPVGAPPVNLMPMLIEQGRGLLDEAVAQAAKEGVQAKAVLLDSPGRRAADGIVEEAAKLGADLIVLGTHGRRGLSRALLGSDAEEVVRSAAVPVLLVKAGAAR